MKVDKKLSDGFLVYFAPYLKWAGGDKSLIIHD